MKEKSWNILPRAEALAKGIQSEDLSLMSLPVNGFQAGEIRALRLAQAARHGKRQAAAA